MSHPTPWRIAGSVIYDNDGDSVNEPFSLDAEDMERIVACVNFCRHRPTEFLEKHQLAQVPEEGLSTFRLRDMNLRSVPRLVGLAPVQEVQ